MGHANSQLEKMTDSSEPFDVRQVSNRSADYAPAIHMAMALGSPSARAPDPQVAELQASARAGLVTIDLLFGAYRGGKLCSACLAIESPGGAAKVMLPHIRRRAVQSDATVAAPHALQRGAGERGDGPPGGLRTAYAIQHRQSPGSGNPCDAAYFQRLPHCFRAFSVPPLKSD